MRKVVYSVWVYLLSVRRYATQRVCEREQRLMGNGTTAARSLVLLGKRSAENLGYQLRRAAGTSAWNLKRCRKVFTDHTQSSPQWRARDEAQVHVDFQTNPMYSFHLLSSCTRHHGFSTTNKSIPPLTIGIGMNRGLAPEGRSAHKPNHGITFRRLDKTRPDHIQDMEAWQGMASHRRDEFILPITARNQTRST